MGIGTGLGVSATPALFINGRLLAGAQPYETFVSIIDEELERTKK
jgi:protein-disulfide isomerase